MQLVRLKDKGQVTLPMKVRTAIGAEIGDVFEVEIRGEEIVLVRRGSRTSLEATSSVC